MLGPPVDPADVPTESFRAVPPPDALIPATADLPDVLSNVVEGHDDSDRLMMQALDAFNVVSSMSLADRLEWVFGAADPHEPTPVWDAMMLEMADVRVDGDVDG